MSTKALWNIYQKEIKQCINDIKNGQIKKQIANILTVSRLFSPFVIIPIALLKLYIPTIILTILFALTDTLDGYFARKYNAVSNFGKDLDAAVDKVFSTTLLIAISTINIYLLFLIFMELVIGLINIIEKYKNNNPKTLVIGKFKTILLSLLIIIFMIDLYFKIPTIILFIVYGLTLISQLFTALCYFNKFLKNNYHRKIKIIPENKNGKVINKLSDILLHENIKPKD